MRVSMDASSAVHIQDTRVQGLLIVQREGHCIQTASPILLAWFLEYECSHKCTKERERVITAF